MWRKGNPSALLVGMQTGAATVGNTVENGHHKQSNKQQVLEKLWRTGNPSALLVGLQSGATIMETVWNFLKKLKMELPVDPAIPLLGIYPKNSETPTQKNPCTPMFMEVPITE